MQLLKDVAQQARFAAMQPGLITQHFREQDADLQAFERAVAFANAARAFRDAKACGNADRTPGQWEGRARKAERRVREIALSSEIILARRARDRQADNAMMGILMGVAS